MEFDYYEEDQMQLLKDLAARTMAGTIEWKDIEYNPIAVLGTEKDDGHQNIDKAADVGSLAFFRLDKP